MVDTFRYLSSTPCNSVWRDCTSLCKFWLIPQMELILSLVQSSIRLSHPTASQSQLWELEYGASCMLGLVQADSLFAFLCYWYCGMEETESEIACLVSGYIWMTCYIIEVYVQLFCGANTLEQWMYKYELFRRESSLTDCKTKKKKKGEWGEWLKMHESKSILKIIVLLAYHCCLPVIPDVILCGWLTKLNCLPMVCCCHHRYC